jgi:hypothetical protein
MKPEGSSPHSQQPATFPYHKPDQSSSRPPTDVFKNHFNIIFPPTSRSSSWSLSLRSLHQNLVRTSPVPHTCHVPRPSYSWLGLPGCEWLEAIFPPPLCASMCMSWGDLYPLSATVSSVLQYSIFQWISHHDIAWQHAAIAAGLHITAQPIYYSYGTVPATLSS